MYPTGTKFKTKDGKKWEIIKNNNGLYSTCVCKDGKTYEFRDFTIKDLEGAEFINE